MNKNDVSNSTMILKNLKVVNTSLGCVGFPLAVEFSKKRSVVGFNTNTKRITKLQADQVSSL